MNNMKPSIEDVFGENFLFKKANFNFGTGKERWVTYNLNGESKFVARFKYTNPGKSARHFVKFLIENFTVAEYFKLLEIDKIAPALILETKGYECYNVLRTKHIEQKLVYSF